MKRHAAHPRRILALDARASWGRPCLAALALAWILTGGARAQGVPPAGGSPQGVPGEWSPPPERGSVARPLGMAVIGDYGSGSANEQAVAAEVKRWNPAFVLTVGDNNYPSGSAATIDAHIGQFYHEFLFPYGGSYGPGSWTNRFFPALGNHDWLTPGAQPYLDYFTLPEAYPGNERYYDVRLGPVHVFVLDSDGNEPDGITATSVQAQWLQAALAASPAPFRMVLLHHAPYSSSSHGSQLSLQWPYRAWGADAVLAGHDHVYERLRVGGLPYVVDGLGGASRYSFGDLVAGSKASYRDDYGAILLQATPARLVFRFVAQDGTVVDHFTLPRGGVPASESSLVPAGSVWRYKDDGVDPGPAWAQSGYDDSSWASGPAQLGYGDGDEATVVSFGANPDRKYITTWFRQTFFVADPTTAIAPVVRLLRDDGAVVFLNGTEVFRTNLPPGTITSSTLALTAIAGTKESFFYEAALDPSLLLAGNNLLAVEMHQASPSSSDLSFDLSLDALLGATRLVPAGSAWRYKDDGVDPGAGWRAVTFDDSSWASGPAQLGYGDGDEATVVSYGPDPDNKYTTTWFRHAFAVADATAWHGLLLRTLRDDGVSVSLNGEEIYRQNLPLRGLDATDWASAVIAGSNESAFLETAVDPSLLRTGSNVLAVEVHQATPASSDLSLDVELIGLP